VILMSTLQDNDPSRARGIAERSGVQWRPADLDLSRDVLSDALTGLHDYVSESGFAYSVANLRALDAGDVDRLLREVM